MEGSNKSPWSRKRKLEARMQGLREAKINKLQPSHSTDSDASSSVAGPSEPVTESPEEPGLSVSLDDSLRVPINAAQLSDDASSDSCASDDGSNFTITEANVVYDQWLNSQPKDSLKTMATMVMDMLMDRLNFTTVGAAAEVGMLLNLSEKTVQTWRRDFYQNKGHFTESKQGKHSRNSILDDENLRSKAATWVRANATVRGQPNMTGAKFGLWVNSELLPNTDLLPGCPQEIRPRTAVKWLHRLGFRPQSHRKSVYIDGHEREDVIEYRKLYLQKIEILSSTHLPPPTCSDGLTAFETGNPAAKKGLINIFHDESSFHANEGHSVMWAEEGSANPVLKIRAGG